MEIPGAVRDFLRRRIQQFGDEGLIRLPVLARHPAKLQQQGWVDPNRNELLGLTPTSVAQRAWPAPILRRSIRERPRNQADDPAYAVRSLRLAWRALMMRLFLCHRSTS
ncbi:MAG TPA: hypothetical protein VEL28_03910 [Candidatus Binatia bacterium]|nr:hypothetical protein [Candidatus Binatia bacterium]